MSEQTSTANNGYGVGAATIGIISAVLVVMGIWFGIVGGIIALILGLIGIQKAKRLAGHGLGLAITGTIIGATIFLILGWVSLY